MNKTLFLASSKTKKAKFRLVLGPYESKFRSERSGSVDTLAVCVANKLEQLVPVFS